MQRENCFWLIDKQNKNVQNAEISNCKIVELDELL